MMIEKIRELCLGEWTSSPSQGVIGPLVVDSRRARIYDESALFIALSGANHDGHDFLPEAYAMGIRHFMVERKVSPPGPEGHVIQVKNTRQSLQLLGGYKRHTNESIEVVGITGSNGKTIVKEWLATMLSPFTKLVRSPGSFNSQVGVPLSLWQIGEEHQTGLFEAGISLMGEMAKLQRIIDPTVGIFTNIGPAHETGFASIEAKVNEKMSLFQQSECLIYCRDHALIHASLICPGYSWGRHEGADLQISGEESEGEGMRVYLRKADESFALFMPFTDPASIENAMHAVCYLVWKGFDRAIIQEGLLRLRPMTMRLELKRGIKNASIIDDTYNNDLSGIQTALDYMSTQPARVRKLLIVSDILHSNTNDWLERIIEIAQASAVDELIGIGSEWSLYHEAGSISMQTFESTKDFLAWVEDSWVADALVLIKGARPFQFERITSRFEEKIHGTVLEVDLEAATINLNHFRSLLKPGVRLMVMVKAFAYGSGSVEIARMLKFHRVDYLGVAYVDEGIYLRNQGIDLPIMVMNPSPDALEAMVKYNLEPEIYSERLLHEVLGALGTASLTVHIKFDTGMHRLGFESVGAWAHTLANAKNITVASVFTHLASADNPPDDSFTLGQLAKFELLSDGLTELLGYRPLRHALNSSGCMRFPEHHYEMVRLGIGLHGIGKNLKPVSRLRTYISQIKTVESGESIGYGRRGIAERTMQIATIAIGYADGYSRAFSEGVGKVWIKGQLAPVIGSVCMDMTMIDITELPAVEGDEVEIFGNHLPIEQVASWINTIPYELLTDVSQRVRRIYVS